MIHILLIFVLLYIDAYIPNTKSKINIRNMLFGKSKKFNNLDDTSSRLDNFDLLYIPKTKNQQLYVNYLQEHNKKLIIANGPAGCGKTLFACKEAIKLFEKRKIEKIILTRPTVHIDEEAFGFLPGTLNEKMDPWLKPFFDVFLYYYNQKEIDNLLYNNNIEICPITYMRGRTFHNSFVISDEMQNSSPHQMKTLLTRMGENSKLIILGDTSQSDLTFKNGLEDILNKLKIYNSKIITHIYFNNTDVMRSKLTKEILRIYDNDENNKLIGKYNISYEDISKNTSYNNSRNNTFQRVTDNIKTKNCDCAFIPKNQFPKHQEI